MYRRLLRNMSTSVPQIIKSETPGPIELSIISKVTNEFKPSYFKIVNDSHKHAHHAGIRGATNTTESHFRLEIISDTFSGKTLPTRHRLVYSLLDDELKNHGVHALQMKTKTEQEANKTKD
ncbi:BOL1 BolA-like protein 1 [Candida maltosa Xu316]